MTDKEHITIDTNKCKYRDKYTNFCLAEKDEIGETYIICTGTDCYFKQLVRKTQECEGLREQFAEVSKTLNRYRKALEDIEAIIKTPCEYCQPTSRCKICIEVSILDIINKAKEEE